MRPEPLRRSLGLWFPAWALPAEVNTPPRRSRSAALRMTRQNNKEYYVCSCGAWIYADKVKKGMATHCQQCWRPWPKPRPSFTQWPSPAPKPPNQQRVPFPSPKPRSRPRRVKGAEVWKEHWDSENFCRTTKRLQSRSSSQTTVQVKQEKLWVKLVTLQRRKGLSPRLELCLRHTLKLAMALCQSCVQESHM